MLTSPIYKLLLAGTALVPLSLPLMIFFSPSNSDTGWTGNVLVIGELFLGVTILYVCIAFIVILIRSTLLGKPID